MRPVTLLGLVLTACAPLGRIRSPRLTDRLRTAWTLDTAWGGAPTRVLILSTSAMPCGPPDNKDPDAITAADAQLALAWSREGSLLLAFVLFSTDTTDWNGTFPVDEAASAWAVDEQEPRAALAAFHAVWEAEVSEEDGLYREYLPVDETLALPVPGPGTITVEEDGASSSGTFALDALDVSGNFHAEACPDGLDDLLGTDLLATLLGLWVRDEQGQVVP